MKKELERLQKLDVITPVTKPTDWVSQAVILQKADKSVRLCIDPRPLNQALMQRKRPAPPHCHKRYRSQAMIDRPNKPNRNANST